MKKNLRRHYTIQTVLLAGILFFSYLFITRYFPESFDLSEDKRYSLTPALQEFIEEYSEELKIFSFIKGSSPQIQYFRNFLDELARLNPRITVHYGRPADAAEHLEGFRGMLRDDSFLLVEGERKKVVHGMDREHFLRQLYLFCNQIELKVGYLTGYDQMPLYDKENPQFSLEAFQSIMENSGFIVEEITFDQLLTDSYFLVLLVSPMQDIDTQDLQYLEMYWNHGGNLLIATDPVLRASRDTVLPVFFQEKWGLKMVQGITIQHSPIDAFIDRNPLKIEIEDIIHPFFQLHFREHGELLLRISSSFIETKEHSAQRIPLFQTNENTWLQRDRNQLLAGSISFDPDVDLPPPLHPAYAIEQEHNRALLFADSDWLTNQMIFEKNNYDFVQAVLRYFAPEIRAIKHLPGTYRIKPMMWDSLTQRRILTVSGIVLALALLGLIFNIVMDKKS